MRNDYKSRAERQIGTFLSRQNIPFIYEKPTAVIDDGKTRIYYPDFSLAYGPMIEYFGIINNQDYQKRTRHKLKVYEDNQLAVIPVYPSDMRGPWPQNLLRRIDSQLQNHLDDYRSRTGIGNPYYSYSEFDKASSR